MQFHWFQWSSTKNSAFRDGLDTPTCQLQEISGILGHLIQLDHLQGRPTGRPTGTSLSDRDLLLPCFTLRGDIHGSCVAFWGTISRVMPTQIEGPRKFLNRGWLNYMHTLCIYIYMSTLAKHAYTLVYYIPHTIAHRFIKKPAEQFKKWLKKMNMPNTWTPMDFDFKAPSSWHNPFVQHHGAPWVHHLRLPA